MWACLRPVGTRQFSWFLVLAVLAAIFQSPSEGRPQQRHQCDGAAPIRDKGALGAIGAHQRGCLPAALSSEDCPGLITKGQSTETIADGAVVAACSWPQASDGYRRIAESVDRFFSHFDEFTKPPRHSAWRGVSLAADLPGWKWFPEAKSWFDNHWVVVDAQADFNSFLPQQAGGLSAVHTAHPARRAVSRVFEVQRGASARLLAKKPETSSARRSIGSTVGSRRRA